SAPAHCPLYGIAEQLASTRELAAEHDDVRVHDVAHHRQGIADALTDVLDDSGARLGAFRNRRDGLGHPRLRTEHRLEALGDGVEAGVEHEAAALRAGTRRSHRIDAHVPELSRA